MHDLEVLLSRELLVLDNLDPVAIRVQQKGNILHASICKSLLPANVLILESLAGSFKVIHRNTCLVSFIHAHLHADQLTDVAKALGLTVTIVVLEVLVLLGAVVPSQFEQALSVSNGIVVLTLREGLVARVAKEVEVEASLGVLKGAESRHAKDFLVVLQGLLGILDAKHGVVLVH
jgi:hypothetical protein